MPEANVNGGPLTYDCQGEGPALLLIPARGMGSWCWFRQVPAIKRLAKVVTFEPRWTGLPNMARDVVGLLQALEIPKATLAGIGLGSVVALQMAAERPEMAERLVLASASRALSPEAERLRGEIAGLDGESRFRHELGLMVAPGFTGRNPGLLDTLVERYRNQPLPLDLSWPFDDGGAIYAPALVIAGQEDRWQAAGSAEALAAALPDGRFESVPGAGHLPNIERPEVFNRLLMNFVFEALYPSGGARRGVEG